MSIYGVVDEEMVEDMEAGLAATELSCRDGVLVASRQLQVGDDEADTELRRVSDIVEVEATPTSNTTEMTALGVAATAAVELTNLFFLLRGDAERLCSCWVEGLAVLFAFAAFLSAAGVLLLLRGHRNATIVSAWCARVVLVACAASLFVASAGTALSLLHGHGLLLFGARAIHTGIVTVI